MMLREIALSSVLAIGWAASAAAADAALLRGPYGFTGEAGCVGTRTGFTPELRALPLNYTRRFTVEGVRTFNGDGTGTVKATVLGDYLPAFPPPSPPPAGPLPSVGGGEFHFNFTYTVDDDGDGWTARMVPGSYQETITSGPRTGQTVVVDEIPPIVGMISQDHKTLTGAQLKPQQETHTYSNGDVEREICHRSRVFIRVNDSDLDNGNAEPGHNGNGNDNDGGNNNQ